MRLEYRVLGPLDVTCDGVALNLGGLVQQRILAALILDANRTVSTARLAAVAWGADPPVTAHRQVQNRIAALRAVLTAAGAAPVLKSATGGYRLSVPPESVDALVFEGLCGAGAAPAELRTALRLWRGPALAGLSLDQEAGALEEKRVTALERCLELELAAGKPVIAELSELVREQPFRERPVGLLMTALYRAGRQSEALTCYRDLAARLADELGLDPGPEVRRLHERILRADPNLDPADKAQSGTTATAAPPPSLCLLPSDVADFTGRNQQVAELRCMLRPDASVSAVVVSAIAGKGGVGKTALAVHAAHRLRDQFPDGQLYVNLHGAGPKPTDPSDVLYGLLLMLGVEGRLIPTSLSERAALYRSRLADKRILVLLDNAADEAQVRPLLPGLPDCRVLITSRSRLVGLAGAHTIALDVLPPAQAIDLLGRVAGPERVAAEPAAAAEIVRLCGYLPLAVRIGGARLAARQHRPLSWLVSRLTDEHRRLDELAVGDLEVRASFALSYQGLKPELQRAFRLLSLIRAPDVAPWVLSALLDVPLIEAEDLLESLVDAQLVEVNIGDRIRCRLHDLVRVYARECLEMDEPEAERHAAVKRFLGACLWLAERAGEHPSSRVYGSMHGPAQRWPLSAEATGPLTDNLARWIEAEQDVLAGAVELACACALSEFAWDLAGSAVGLFAQIGCTAKWEQTHASALAAVRHVHDLRGEAVLLFGQALLAAYRDDPVQADALYSQATTLFERVGDDRGAAIAAAGHAVALLAAGQLAAVETRLLAALDVLRGLSDLRACVYVYRALGTAHLEQGRFSEASGWFGEGLETADRAGFLFGAAYMKCWLARTCGKAGRNVDAIAYSEQALRTFRRINDRTGEAVALQDCGEGYLRLGRPRHARAALEQAIAINEEIGDLSGQAQVLSLMGHLDLSTREPDRAATNFLRAVDISRAIGRPILVARALSGLGKAFEATGDLLQAREARLESLELFKQAGLPAPEDLVDAVSGQGQLTHSSVPSENT
jgi:DNA-binding SARP family transcriptional activator/tetratricopeptide (TPR) repeat protein